VKKSEWRVNNRPGLRANEQQAHGLDRTIISCAVTLRHFAPRSLVSSVVGGNYLGKGRLRRLVLGRLDVCERQRYQDRYAPQIAGPLGSAP